MRILILTLCKRLFFLFLVVTPEIILFYRSKVAEPKEAFKTPFKTRKGRPEGLRSW